MERSKNLSTEHFYVKDYIHFCRYCHTSAEYIAKNGHELGCPVNRIAELEAKLVNAREALGKYGCHKPNCIWIRGTIEKPRACDCGLEEALAALEVEK